MSVDAQYFIDHGVSPDHASALASEHNAMVAAPMGRGQLISPPEASAVSSPNTTSQIIPHSAQAEIDTLLADRMAGKINEYDWRTIHEPRLQALAQAASQEVADPFERLITEAYAPPRSALEYRFPTSSDEATRAQDTALGQAMLAAHVPAHIGRNTIGDVARFAEGLKGLPAETVQTKMAERVAHVRSGLASAWGEQLDANLDAIDRFAEDMTSRHPDVAQTVRQLLPLLNASNMIELHAWLSTRAQRK